MNTPLLSVVIIGRNEGQRLINCIESVQNMDDLGGSVEIIYVDSNSNDGSPDKIRELGIQVVEVKPERPCAAVGRNAGWRIAQAPLVLFLDGDTLLNPQFVNEALKTLQDDSIAVVWGHRREIHPEQSIYNRVLDLDWIYPLGMTDFCGGDALMRKAVLEHCGGYSEDLIAGEEPELCQRIRQHGYQICHIDVPMTLHDLAMHSFKAYWRRAVRTGYAYAEVSQRLKDGPFPLWRSDAQRNLRNAAILTGVGLVAVCSVWAGFFEPLLFALFFYGFLSLRSAWRFRWKSPDWITCVLYGIHSHLQQIPVAIGQLTYWINRYRNRKQHLIEYK
jgi:glycosyltransferase involved in cell wall biosynthesis